jgi:hydrogenase maturation protease
VGNPLRGDDGVAHELCKSLEESYSFEVMRVHQLQTELLDSFVGRKKVIIADASVLVDSPKMVSLDLQSLSTFSTASHQLEASMLVQLFFNYHPQELVQFKLLHLPAFSLDFVEVLSVESTRHLPKAMELVIQEWNEFLSTNHH